MKMACPSMVKRFLILFIFPIILFARAWSVFVYMAADNDLSNFADEDLAEMQLVGSNDDIAVVVQVDQPVIGARRLLVLEGSTVELADLGIVDMCDWQTLAQFIEWGIRNFPADRYCVILWDHGTGWTRIGSKSFGRDWSSGNVMSVAEGELKRAVRTAYDRTREKIDLFGFDACLMQLTEVVYEIKDYIRAFVGPQIICPLEGYRYDEILTAMHADPGMNRRELGTVIVQTSVENYIDVQPVVYAAVDILYLRELVLALDNVLTSFMSGSDRPVIADIRESVQTIPTFGDIPSQDDEHVDLGDFIHHLDDAVASTATQSLVTAYDRLVVASEHWGEDFAQTTGLTVYFPYDYPDFKQLVDNYVGLTWAQETQWPRFLNWYYDADDMRPTDVTLTSSDVGADNDFRLTWDASYDLSPVTYSIVEIMGLESGLFYSACEDTDQWYVDGFSLSSTNVYAGNYSFFSGNTSNLDNSIETRNPIFIEDLGILSIFLDYNTEDMADSLIIEYGSFIDVHYGLSDGWQERTVILPPGNNTLKISYRTNSTTNRGGCYVDEIEVTGINGRYIRQNLSDTTLYIYNKLLGNALYGYVVYPQDSYNNTGNVSNISTVVIPTFAVPYSLPNPFQTSCDIIIDAPGGIELIVEVYALSGRLVRKFSAQEIQDDRVYWDGKDTKGRDVGSGLYYVVARDMNGSFKRIGKIARQR